MNGEVGVPHLPGAIGASHLRVYDSVAPDGLRGGTPHLHTVCTEAYYVVRGQGAVHTLTPAGPAETPLEPGALVWFTPGTVHRLVNGDGELEILVLMQNAGLPEAGDMVIAFPPDDLASRERYDEVAVLPPGDTTTAGSSDPASARRDRGVEGYLRVRAALEAGDAGPLRELYEAAARLVGSRVAAWRDRWKAGPLDAVTRTEAQLDALGAGSAAHLAEASVHRSPPPAGDRRFGCCGTLGTFV